MRPRATDCAWFGGEAARDAQSTNYPATRCVGIKDPASPGTVGAGCISPPVDGLYGGAVLQVDLGEPRWITEVDLHPSNLNVFQGSARDLTDALALGYTLYVSMQPCRATKPFRRLFAQGGDDFAGNPPTQTSQCFFPEGADAVFAQISSESVEIDRNGNHYVEDVELSLIHI